MPRRARLRYEKSEENVVCPLLFYCSNAFFHQLTIYRSHGEPSTSSKFAQAPLFSFAPARDAATRYANQVASLSQRQLCVLNLRMAGSLLARHVVIVSDNVDAEEFRRQRVLLRWGSRRQG